MYFTRVLLGLGLLAASLSAKTLLVLPIALYSLVTRRLPVTHLPGTGSGPVAVGSNVFGAE